MHAPQPNLQEYEQDEHLQAEKARIALLELECASQERDDTALPQKPKRKRRLQTSQKRLLKVVV